MLYRQALKCLQGVSYDKVLRIAVEELEKMLNDISALDFPFQLAYAYISSIRLLIFLASLAHSPLKHRNDLHQLGIRNDRPL
eukprot:COSAG01_NODE_15573_length_1322_cov_2.153720_1_plen_82_part_00